MFSPITADTAENYGMFAEEYFSARDVGHFGAVDDRFETSPAIWTATALLDDYVVLEHGDPFGYVTDLVFEDAGELIAVVAAEARGRIDTRGVYAFPWDDRRWHSAFDHSRCGTRRTTSRGSRRSTTASLSKSARAAGS